MPPPSRRGWKHCRVQSILGSSCCTTEKYGTALQPLSRPLQCPVKSCLFAQQCTSPPPLSQIRQSSDQSLTAFGHAPKIPQIWPNFSQMQHIMWIADQFRAFSLCLSLQTKLWNPNLLILFVREIENVLFELKTTRFSNCCNLRQKFRTQIRLYFGYS